MKTKPLFFPIQYILVIFSFFLFINILSAIPQNIELDSIEKKIKLAKTDIEINEALDQLLFFKKKFRQEIKTHKNENTFDLGYRLAEIQLNNNLDSAFVWYYHCLDLAKEIDDPILIAKTLVDIGSYEFAAQNFKTAVRISEEADSILKKYPDEELLLANLYRLAEAYEYNDNPKGAMEKYSECFGIAEKRNDLRMLTLIDVKLGNINKVNEDYKEAFAYFEKALNRLDKSKHLKYYNYAMGGYSEVVINNPTMFSNKQITNACNNVDLFLEENKLTNNPNIYFFNFLNTHCILLNGSQQEINNLPLISIEEIEKETVIPETLLTKLATNCSIAIKQQKYFQAKKYLQKVKEISHKGQENLGFLKISLLLEKEFFFAKKDFQSAIPVIEKLHKNQLSLENEKRMKSVSNLEGVLKAKEAELEIVLLSKEKEFHKVQAQQNLIIALSIMLIALIGLGYFLNANRKNKIISEQNERLNVLNKTKDHIFAVIGHDLRRPAIAFKGITKKVNHLLKKKDFETLNMLGEEIEKDALALNKLTDNLLNWALMQKDVMPYHPESIPINSTIDEVISIFEKIAKEKNITINSIIPNHLEVYADPNALQTIIRNLLDNALKFTADNGQINISAANTPEGIKLEVNDSGIGMSDEQLNDIFLLQKGKSQRGLEGEKGTGLGMHLVNELTKLNKGTINVISNVDKGTTFRVILPNILT